MIPREDNPFMKGFLCHLGLNWCCYTCRSAEDDRPGDITLGDFWGRPRQDDEHQGVSVVIAHTSKGEAALERVLPALLLSPVDGTLAVSANGGLVAHTGGIPRKRAAFLHAQHHLPLQRALSRFLDSSNRPCPASFCAAASSPTPRSCARLSV